MTETTRREPGYYWVRHHGESDWVIVIWWKRDGWPGPWKDEDFAEIDERRIIRQVKDVIIAGRDGS